MEIEHTNEQNFLHSSYNTIERDAYSNLCVMDKTNNLINKYSSEGEFITQLEIDQLKDSRLISMDVDIEGNIHVIDKYNQCILIYSQNRVRKT